MPTYDYKCDTCGEIAEVFQPISEFKSERLCSGSLTVDGVTYRQRCKGTMRPLIVGTGAFILKGDGYYSTETAKGRAKRALHNSESGDYER